MEPRRELDLTGIYFENVHYPLGPESWYSWLSLSGSFFDQSTNVEYALDESKTEQPCYYVIDKNGKREKEALMKMFVMDGILFQAPPVQRVGLCRLNNAAHYIDVAFDKIVTKRRKIESLEKQQEREDLLVDRTLMSVLHSVVNNQENDIVMQVVQEELEL
jgi:hypothetical protein